MTNLLRMVGISKSFPGVVALQDVDLDLHAGEVLAVVGENGAGKSTLLKMLGGVHQPDAGQILLRDEPQHFRHPKEAMDAGIGLIFQELNLIPQLTAWENISLGRERTRCFVSGRRERQLAANILSQMSVDVPLNVPCSQLSIAQQQLIEIAKALAQQVDILVLDEPTTALSPTEVDGLFRVMRELQDAGIGIIYVSHRLDEIARVATRVQVLRDGRRVDEGVIAQMSRRRMIESMVGRTIEDEFPRRESDIGEIRLRVDGLTRGNTVQHVSFHVRGGEVVGLTGLVGAGRTETARLIFGADSRDAGVVELDGTPLRIRHPRDAIAARICLLTEDRKSHGLHLDFGVRENFGLPNLDHFARWGWIDTRQEVQRTQHFVERLALKVTHLDRPVRNLSGGNQQKVVLAKWLEQNAEVLIFDEPTRGIDVGAKFEIYQLINQLVAAGKAVLLISSELPEVIGMSDRILVMRNGSLAGELSNSPPVTQSQIMELAVG